MGNVDEIELYTFTATSSILLVIYTATLIRVLHGSSFTFVINLIILMMLYNIGVLAHQWLLQVLDHMLANQSFNNSVLIGVLTAEALVVMFEYISFNVAHWMFAFQYYQIAR